MGLRIPATVRCDGWPTWRGCTQEVPVRLHLADDLRIDRVPQTYYVATVAGPLPYGWTYQDDRYLCARCTAERIKPGSGWPDGGAT